ncbi:YdbH domain-containing protein [Pelagibius sp. Alg239-R121]|uniref:intermembrane phospholipid transport protein YdbH family protein n=1 Tax=Pelagibius sp. Alg239-R121 TaxID=2993448 RepID=UPI0024A6381D|nr:YdbH domain-containing protein [Pelagibius sp. Alg239-R121]
MLGKFFRGRLWLAGFIVVGLSVIGAVALRKDVAVWALTKGLEEQGLQVTSLALTQLDWERVSIRRLSVSAPGVSADLDVIDLDYNFTDLLSGTLPTVFLSGAELSLDMDSPWLKDQSGGKDGGTSLGANSETGEPLPAFPEVTIEETLVRLGTPVGPIDLGVEGSVWRDPTAAILGAFSLAANASQGRTTAVVGLTVTPDASVLADVVVEDGNLDVGELTFRGLSGSFSAALNGPKAVFERLDGALTFEKISGALSPDTHLAPIQVSLEAGLEQQDVVFEATLLSGGQTENPSRAKVAGRVAQGDDAATLSVSSSIDTPATLPLFSKFPFPLPEAGQVAAQARIDATMPPLKDLQSIGIFAMPPEQLLQIVSTIKSDFTLRLEALSHPEYLEGFSLDIDGGIQLDDEGLVVRLAQPAAARISALSDKLLDNLALPDDLREWLDGPVKLDLSPIEETAFLRASRANASVGPYFLAAALDAAGEGFSVVTTATGKFSPEAADWSLGGPVAVEAQKLPLRGISGAKGRFNIGIQGEFTSSAAVSVMTGDVKATSKQLIKEDAKIAGLVSMMPFRAELKGQKLNVESTGSAVTTAKRLSTPAVTSTIPLKLHITSSEVEVDLASGIVRPMMVAKMAASGFSFAAEEQEVTLEIEPIDLTISPDRKADGPLLLGIETAGVSITELQLRAANIGLRARADPNTNRLSGEFNDLKLEDLAQPRRFEEVLLDGTFRRDKSGRLDFAAEGRTFQNAITFDVKGRSDPAGGLSVDVNLPTHDFAVTPLNLKDLSWISGAAVDVGSLSGKLHVEILPEGPVGFARIKSEGLAGEALGFPFSDLSMAVELDGLWPPRASVPIRIDLARFDPGLPVSNLRVEALLPEAMPFALDLQDMALTVLGARLSVAGGRVALLDGSADLPIRITGLDLAEILKAADLADVDVSGRLTGDLPISFNDGTVIIQQSKLAATEPGVLRVRSDKVSSLLTGYGDEVNSLVRALEDFHYDDLSLTLEKTAEDDLTLLLSILGNNPAVLEGQPFRLNLNLESNIGQVLNTLGESLEITKDLLSGRYSLQ